MPSAPTRAGDVMGCAHTAPCPTHSAQRRYAERAGTAASRGYDRQWRKKAAAFLRRYPLCGDRPNGLPSVMSKCRDEKIVRLANHVDHVVPHRHNRALFDDLITNAQALCGSCSGRKSRAGL